MYEYGKAYPFLNPAFNASFHRQGTGFWLTNAIIDLPPPPRL